MTASKLQWRSRQCSRAWPGLSPRQSMAQQCRLFRAGTGCVVDYGCQHSGKAGLGLLPTCSGSHYNVKYTYRVSCKSGRSGTRLLRLLGMTREFWVIFDVFWKFVFLSEERTCVLSECKKATGCQYVVSRPFYSLQGDVPCDVTGFLCRRYSHMMSQQIPGYYVTVFRFLVSHAT